MIFTILFIYIILQKLLKKFWNSISFTWSENLTRFLFKCDRHDSVLIHRIFGHLIHHLLFFLLNFLLRHLQLINQTHQNFSFYNGAYFQYLKSHLFLYHLLQTENVTRFFNPNNIFTRSAGIGNCLLYLYFY